MATPKKATAPRTGTARTITPSVVQTPVGGAQSLESLQQTVGNTATTVAADRYAPIPLPRDTGDSRWLLTTQEQVDYVQRNPDVNRKRVHRAPLAFEPPAGGGTVRFGPRTYEFDAKGNLVRASTEALTLGIRDPVLYSKYPGKQAGADFGHLLGVDFGHQDAELGKHGGFPQTSSLNRDTGTGVSPAWYNAERLALTEALRLKDLGVAYRVEAEARGHVNGVPGATRISVYQGNAKTFESAWIANPAAGSAPPAAAAPAAIARGSAPTGNKQGDANRTPGGGRVQTSTDEQRAPRAIAIVGPENIPERVLSANVKEGPTLPPAAERPVSQPVVAAKPTTRYVQDRYAARELEVSNAKVAANQAIGEAVGGGIMMIQAAQVSYLQELEWRKAAREYERLRPVIEKLQRDGEWIFVYATWDLAPFDFFGEIAGYKEGNQIDRFVTLSVQHGPTRELALHPPVQQSTISAASPDVELNYRPAPTGPSEGRRWSDRLYIEIAGTRDPIANNLYESIRRFGPALDQSRMSGLYRSADGARAMTVKVAGQRIEIAAWLEAEHGPLDVRNIRWDPQAGLLACTFVSRQTGEVIENRMAFINGQLLVSFGTTPVGGGLALRSQGIWARDGGQ